MGITWIPERLRKGKAHKRYEFGVKASFATTNDTGYIVGARSYPGNPYDGHTLEDQLQQVEIITGLKPTHCYVDRGVNATQKARVIAADMGSLVSM